MSDNLDTLSDRELDELFAREVCGWSLVPDGFGFDSNWCETTHPYAQKARGSVFHPTTDANAVLPWLEKNCALSRLHIAEVYPAVGNRLPVCWHVTILVTGALGAESSVVGTTTTFPRAAVIALLRAKRAEKAA